MERARLDQMNVAGECRNPIADFEKRAVLDALTHLHFRDGTVDAVDQRRSRLGVHDVPKLGLAGFVVFPDCVLVVGMDLDR